MRPVSNTSPRSAKRQRVGDVFQRKTAKQLWLEDNAHNYDGLPADLKKSVSDYHWKDLAPEKKQPYITKAQEQKGIRQQKQMTHVQTHVAFIYLFILGIVKEAVDDFERPLSPVVQLRDQQPPAHPLLNKDDSDYEDEQAAADLRAAASRGKLGDVRKLLKKRGVSKEAVDKRGRNPLHYAVARQEQVYKQCINALCIFGFDINCRDKDGNTPLDLAYEKGSFQFCRLYLEDKKGALRGYQLFEKDFQPLIRDSTDVERIRACLTKYSPRKPSELLHQAVLAFPGKNNVSRGRRDEAPVTFSNDDISTPVLQLLLDAKADVNFGQSRISSLNKTIPKSDSGAFDMIHSYFTCGISSLAEAQKRVSLLELAMARGLVNVVRFLLANGVTFKYNGAGKSDFRPFRFACDETHGTTRCQILGVLVEHLLTKTTNVRAVDRDGLQLLHYAAYAGSASALRSLLEKNVDVHAASVKGNDPDRVYGEIRREGRSALHYVVISEQVFEQKKQCVEVLLTHGVCTNLISYDCWGRCQTPYGLAMSTQQSGEFRKFLSEKGFLSLPQLEKKLMGLVRKGDARELTQFLNQNYGRDGNSAKHLVSEVMTHVNNRSSNRKKDDIPTQSLQVLVRHGANPCDSEALEHAINKKHDNVVHFLRHCGAQTSQELPY